MGTTDAGATPGPGATPGQTQDQGQADQAGATPASFDAWLQAQPEPVKGLVAQRFSALESTVRATRDERDGLSKQVRDLLPKAEKGSALEKSLQELGSRLEQAERRNAFYDSALQPGIDCKNLKAALAIATASELFDRRGQPDWAAIKAEAPELFGKPGGAPNANAGQGTAPNAVNMNDLIRKAAGR